MLQNNLRQVRLLVYKLKRLMGSPIIITRNLANTTNPKTGKVTKTLQTISVRRAIVLTARELRDFDRLVIGKIYGGFYDSTTRFVVLDRTDLPANFVLTLNDRVTVNSKQYNIKDITEPEHRAAYILTISGVANQDD